MALQRERSEEDTERLRVCKRVTKLISYRGNDPNEDTESDIDFSLSHLSHQVAEGTIRTRILKEH